MPRIAMLASTLMVPGFTAARVVPPMTEPMITKPQIVAKLRTTRKEAPYSL